MHPPVCRSWTVTVATFVYFIYEEWNTCCYNDIHGLFSPLFVFQNFLMWSEFQHLQSLLRTGATPVDSWHEILFFSTVLSYQYCSLIIPLKFDYWFDVVIGRDLKNTQQYICSARGYFYRFDFVWVLEWYSYYADREKIVKYHDCGVGSTSWMRGLQHKSRVFSRVA